MSPFQIFSMQLFTLSNVSGNRPVAIPLRVTAKYYKIKSNRWTVLDLDGRSLQNFGLLFLDYVFALHALHALQNSYLSRAFQTSIPIFSSDKNFLGCQGVTVREHISFAMISLICKSFCGVYLHYSLDLFDWSFERKTYTWWSPKSSHSWNPADFMWNRKTTCKEL